MSAQYDILVCRPMPVHELSILARSSFVTRSKARYCSLVVPNCRALDSALTIFRISATPPYRWALTSVSPFVGEISSDDVNLQDKGDLESVEEVYPPGSLLEINQSRHISLTSKFPIEMGGFVLLFVSFKPINAAKAMRRET